MKEIKSLTGLRGVGAFYVFVRHAVLTKNHFALNGFVSVDVFLILSGYILSLVYKNKFSSSLRKSDIKEYFKKRCFRIYPVYFFILLISLAFITIFGEPPRGRQVVENLLLIQSVVFCDYDSFIPSAWSLSAEFILYSLFPLMFYVLSRYNFSHLSIFIISIPCLNYVFYQYMPGYHFGDIFAPGWGLVRCFFDYLFGIIVFLSSSLDLKKNKGIWVDIMFLLILLLCFMGGYNIIIILITCFFIKNLDGSFSFVEKFLSLRPLRYFGEISYSFYLWHTVLIYRMGPVFSDLIFKKCKYHEVFNFLFFSIAFSILTYHLIEVPSRRYLRRNFSF